VEIEVSGIDLLGLDLDCRFVGRLPQDAAKA
jgi:hypothetical protein